MLVTVSGVPTWPFPSVALVATEYTPDGITGEVYAKLELWLPGLLRNAVRQVGTVLVNVPVELMYWPRLLTIATSTRAMLMSSSARPLTTIRPWVKLAPVCGAPRSGSKPGSASPGNTRYRAVAPTVDGSV